MLKILFLLSLLTVLSESKWFGKCKLARLFFQHGMDGFHGYFLEDWVCMTYHTSYFNSKAHKVVENISYYGIFQLTGILYCEEKDPKIDLYSPGSVICDYCCDKFIDGDINDDITCLKNIIEHEGGLDGWDAWRIHCKDQDNSVWTRGCKIDRRRRSSAIE